MPNWCDVSLSVYAKNEQAKKLLQEVKRDFENSQKIEDCETGIFHSLYPTPDFSHIEELTPKGWTLSDFGNNGSEPTHLVNRSKRDKNGDFITKPTEGKLKEALDKMNGKFNWYSWRNSFYGWGTKWDMKRGDDETHQIEFEDSSLHISGMTAWSPPNYCFKNFLEQRADPIGAKYAIVIDYAEQGADFAGRCTFVPFDDLPEHDGLDSCWTYEEAHDKFDDHSFCNEETKMDLIESTLESDGHQWFSDNEKDDIPDIKGELGELWEYDSFDTAGSWIQKDKAFPKTMYVRLGDDKWADRHGKTWFINREYEQSYDWITFHPDL